jgi:hypothetical protein
MTPGSRCSQEQVVGRRKSCSATIQSLTRKLVAAQLVSKLKVLVKSKLLLLMSRNRRWPMALEVVELRQLARWQLALEPRKKSCSVTSFPKKMGCLVCYCSPMVPVR